VSGNLLQARDPIGLQTVMEGDGHPPTQQDAVENNEAREQYAPNTLEYFSELAAGPPDLERLPSHARSQLQTHAWGIAVSVVGDRKSARWYHRDPSTGGVWEEFDPCDYDALGCSGASSVDDIEILTDVASVGGKYFLRRAGQVIVRHVLRRTGGNLSREAAWRWIDRVRAHNGMTVLGETVPRRGDGLGTVALVEGASDDAVYAGINSTARTAKDDAMMRQVYEEMDEAGRWGASTTGYGHGEAQILTHAEAQALVSYARSGESATSVRMFVDRATCGNCRSHLTSLMQHLGIQRVEIIQKGIDTPIVIDLARPTTF